MKIDTWKNRQQKLVVILRDKITAYLENKNENSVALSRKTGISVALLKRILFADITMLPISNAYRILRIVSPSDVASLLQEHYPSRRAEFDSVDRQAHALDWVIQNRISYLVHSMVSTSLKATRADIEKAFGTIGIAALQDMLDQSFLIEKSCGKIEDPYFDLCHTDEECLKQMIRYNLDSFDESKPSGLINTIDGYSDKGIQELRDAFAAYSRRVLDITKDPVMVGKRYFFTSVVCGEFGSHGHGNPTDRNYQVKRKQLDEDTSIAVAGLVHDMRAPFNQVIQFIEMHSKADRAAADAKKARNAARRLELMIDALKRLEGEGIVCRQSEVFCMDSILELGESLASDSSLAFSYEGKTEFQGYIDAEKVDRLIQNLLMNAFEAAQCEVTFEFVREKDAVVFIVTDDGLGVPEDLTEKIFQRGFTHGKAQGTGFGLVNVKNIAEGHDGEVFYDRRDGKTIFTAILRKVFVDAEFERELETISVLIPILCEAPISKPILFVDRFQEEMQRELPEYEVSDDMEDLTRSWLACTDNLATALKATEAGVQRVWTPSPDMMSHEAFLPALKNLANLELKKYQNVIERTRA